MRKNKRYLVKLDQCPHCKEELKYSSESSDMKKTMYSIFKLIDIHRNRCLNLKGRKTASILVRKRKNKKGVLISEYKSNKILF